jgi:hypothetical protein
VIVGRALFGAVARRVERQDDRGDDQREAAREHVHGGLAVRRVLLDEVAAHRAAARAQHAADEVAPAGAQPRDRLDDGHRLGAQQAAAHDALAVGGHVVGAGLALRRDQGRGPEECGGGEQGRPVRLAGECHECLDWCRDPTMVFTWPGTLLG